MHAPQIFVFTSLMFLCPLRRTTLQKEHREGSVDVEDLSETAKMDSVQVLKGVGTENDNDDDDGEGKDDEKGKDDEDGEGR